MTQCKYFRPCCRNSISTCNNLPTEKTRTLLMVLQRLFSFPSESLARLLDPQTQGMEERQVLFPQPPQPLHFWSGLPKQAATRSTKTNSLSSKACSGEPKHDVWLSHVDSSAKCGVHSPILHPKNEGRKFEDDRQPFLLRTASMR